MFINLYIYLHTSYGPVYLQKLLFFFSYDITDTCSLARPVATGQDNIKVIFLSRSGKSYEMLLNPLRETLNILSKPGQSK